MVETRTLVVDVDDTISTHNNRDYETIAMNMAELKRFIDQQQQIIVYYEKAVAPKEKKEKKDVER